MKINKDKVKRHNNEVNKQINQINYEIAELMKERGRLEKLIWREDSDKSNWLSGFGSDLEEKW